MRGLLPVEPLWPQGAEQVVRVDTLAAQGMLIGEPLARPWG